MGKPQAPDKKDVGKWLKQLAKNDKNYGRDSKKNPNNQPKKGW